MITKAYKLLFICTFALFLLIACSDTPSKATTASKSTEISEVDNNWNPLIRAYWTLSSITNDKGVRSNNLRSGLPVNKVKLLFNKNKIGFHSGCNGHGGKIKLLAENKFLVLDLIGTLMGCKKILQDGEIEFSGYIRELDSYEVSGTSIKPVLILTTKNNVILSFNGELTPETKYGAPKRFVIEVNRWRKKDCLLRTCIQWRIVKPNKNNSGANYRFDKQWIPSVKGGVWNNTLPLINKFKPVINRKHIVQIKEFKSEKIPSGVLWVNDGELSSFSLSN